MSKQINAQKRARRGRHLNRWRASKGCEICGIKDIRVLHWAHRVPVLRKRLDKVSQNNACISTLLVSSLKRLMKEVRKCKILCANCHAIETHEERLQQRGKKDE